MLDFAEAVSYRINYDDILIYINKLKERYSAEYYRKHILDIRRLLKHLNHPLADSLKLPRLPRKRKIVIKKEHVREFIKLLEENNRPLQAARAKAAVLLCATSGLRTEELSKLSIDDIDIENRTIFLSAEKSKTREERVVFFNEEAREALKVYLGMNKSYFPFKYTSLVKPFKNVRDKTKLRLKHMRKFFIQEWERCSGSLAIKRMLAGGSDEDNILDPKRLLTGHNSIEIELQSYNFQEAEDLKKIYDAVDIRIFD